MVHHCRSIVHFQYALQHFNIPNGTHECPLSPSMFNLMSKPLAKAIQSHPSISGFQFISKHHKMHLFAGDVILIITNPQTSILCAYQVLNRFSSLSYYKVNYTKSLSLDLGISESTKMFLQCTLPYLWSDKGIPYLGITLTSNTCTLPNSNYCTNP